MYGLFFHEENERERVENSRTMGSPICERYVTSRVGLNEIRYENGDVDRNEIYIKNILTQLLHAREPTDK